LRIDVARRSFIGQRGRAYLADQGIRGFARTVRSLLGIENPTLAACYQALEQLPRGTLGREYFEFVRKNDFSLPGEKHAPPEVIVFHDCLHVLGGYDTVSLEETQIACFQAGMLRKDPLYGLLFMLSQFHLGLQMTPVTGPEKMLADPVLMLEAFARGTKVTRDLCVDWRPQDDFERTVEDLRRGYNIEPRRVRTASI
jgi:ubiquinone biosynthesis protein Coq4